MVTDSINGVARMSVFEETYNNIGEGFQEIYQALEKINERGGGVSVQDTLALNHAIFQYGMYQEVVTKLATKSATAVNDVMKSQ
ncbi:EscI/YscI/HrpB family type III secretion system inner rod protein [Shewanella waksmanii]|uniref:EscI/YscI/HrpB family type III secretion system inner rod protein n=1 Tax=Shewanella waksmanii TaxID=213783 RepID=UPI003736E9B7